LLDIFIDADASPFKKEVYKVADRYKLKVYVVANSWIRIPDNERYTLKIVGKELDAADNWIIEEVNSDDIVITADIPLASECLKKGAHVIGARGKQLTNDNIGDIVATRDLLTELRDAGEITSGPPPLKKSDRSNFLQLLDQIIQKVIRSNK
jgi:uncharacterized protein YaiI (UPF0178 family)